MSPLLMLALTHMAVGLVGWFVRHKFAPADATPAVPASKVSPLAELLAGYQAHKAEVVKVEQQAGELFGPALQPVMQQLLAQLIAAQQAAPAVVPAPKAA